MSSPHQKKESLLARAAESQRRNGKLPDTRTDEAIWSGVLSELDRKAAEPAARPRLDRNPARSAAVALERDGAQLLEGKAARKALQRVAPRRARQTPEAKAACKRLRILSLMPEWQRQVIAAMDEGARKARTMGAKDMRLLIWLEVRKVLDASDKALGYPWEGEAPKRVSVSG